MSWITRGVRRAFRLQLRTGEQVARELDDEFRFHLEMREAELRDAGWPPEAARAEARRRFGDLDDARSYCRALDRAATRTRRRRDWRAGWAHDLRSAVRQLRAAPGVTLAAMLTLALGIGATTALFSVVYKLLFAPLPYPDGDRLVSLMSTQGDGQVMISVSPGGPLLEAWRSARTLERFEVYASRELARTDGDEPELLQAAAISPGMPELLGLRPAFGRLFRPDEATAGAAPVALLGYGYWQRAFGGAIDVLGRTITLDGQSHTIVGVLPREFVLPFDGGQNRPVLVPHVTDPTARGGGSIIARMRPGATPEMASAELTAIVERLAADGVKGVNGEMGARAWSMRDDVGSGTRDMLLVLLAATGVVLLIACANVAGLLLARAAARQRELAVRAALGAGRGRIVRQLLVESALLGLLGGVAGLAVAWGAVRLVVALRPPSLDELAGLQPQPLVLGAALLLATLTGIAFGLAPALFAADRGAAATLTGAARTSTGHRRSQRLRATLVLLEVALSVVLLVGAGLLLRSVRALNAVDIGFDSRGLTAVTLESPEERYADEAARMDLYARVVAAVRRVPGVTDAITASGVPPRAGLTVGRLELDGRDLAMDDRVTMLGYTAVGPGHFAFLGLPLRAGRIPADTLGSPVLISERLATRYWPDGRAVGQRLRMRDGDDWHTVAGVVADVRIPNSGPVFDYQMYELSPAGWPGQTTLVLRTAEGATDVMGAVTRAVLAIDPSLKLHDVWTVEAALDERFAGPRFSMTLLVAFATLALVLATVGLYGVIAYAVTQRTREIGVRIALGARPQRVVRLVVRQAALLAGGGVVLGLTGAAAATRVLESMLFGVEPLDAPTFAAVAALLGLVALIAAYAPARRAARVDPAVALRSE